MTSSHGPGSGDCDLGLDIQSRSIRKRTKTLYGAGLTIPGKIRGPSRTG